MTNFSLCMCSRCGMILECKKATNLDFYNINNGDNIHYLKLCPNCANDVFMDIVSYKYKDIFKKVEE